MLSINAIRVRDFGPFKGDQTVSLPSEEGVTIVYGENMRGKTSLLNAIRFAFFGKVMGRGARELPLHDIGNWEQAKAGKFGFTVELEFTYDRHSYTLTRSFRPRSGIKKPESDQDYVLETFLKKGTAILGPHDTEDELKRILPEQISRFFLFDGELLQQYEDLLRAESAMGPRISEAIERILGVPVLTGARATLARLKDKSERRETLAAQGDQRTREYGNQLADLKAQRDALLTDETRLERTLEKLRSEKASLEEAMKKKERVAALLERRDSATRVVEGLKSRLSEKDSLLKEAMGSAWYAMLSPAVVTATLELRSREKALETDLMRRDFLRTLQADTSAECPACLQQVSDEARKRIREALAGEQGAEQLTASSELSSLRRMLAAAESAASTGQADALKIRWDAYEEIQRDLYSRTEDLAELKRQLAEVDEDALRHIKGEYETTIRKVEAEEMGLHLTRTQLEDNKTNTEKLQKRLDQLAGGSLSDERRRRTVYSQLHDLFSSAVDAYRDRLREDVARDATKLFKQLTTEPDYEGLRINASYGLTIVHKDGSDIHVRSAGAEHVVALSLMGAIQKNAPLSGPIIIDSPFGRLDSGHTTNIVRALPSMAKQVVLLVYEDELPADLARSELRGRLRSEFRLERRSARHTEIVARRG